MKHLFLSILMLPLAASESAARWFPFAFDSPAAFGVHNDTLFASQTGGDVYRYAPTTPDKWVISDNGLAPGTGNKAVTCFGSIGTTFLAAANGSAGGTYTAVFRSTDNGSSWSEILPRITANCFASNGNYIFAAGTDVLRSSDAGVTWSASDSGIRNYHIYSLAILGSTLFAGASGGVFRSTDSGKSWKPTSMTTATDAFAVVGTILVAGSDFAGIYRSTDGGIDWTKNDTGLFNPFVNSLVTDGKNIFAGTGSVGQGRSGGGSGVFLSTDSGLTWNTVNDGIPQTGPDKYLNISTLCIFDTLLLAGVWDDAGVFSYAYARPISEMVPKSAVQQLAAQPPLTISAYPNPLSNSATISYSLPEASEVTIVISDALGRMFSIPVARYEDAGAHQINFDASHLVPGMYWCRLTAGDRVQITKFIIER